MGRFLLTTVTAAFAAIMLSGCMTAAFAPTSADVQSYAIKSVSMSGVAPQAVADAVSADLASAIRATSPKPGAAPVQMAVAISGFSGSRAATGYKAGADVTVTLKPSAGARSCRPPRSTKMQCRWTRRGRRRSSPRKLQHGYAGISVCRLPRHRQRPTCRAPAYRAGRPCLRSRRCRTRRAVIRRFQAMRSRR